MINYLVLIKEDTILSCIHHFGLTVRLGAAYRAVVVDGGVVEEESEEEGVEDVAKEVHTVFIHWTNLTLISVYLVLISRID